MSINPFYDPNDKLTTRQHVLDQKEPPIPIEARVFFDPSTRIHFPKLTRLVTRESEESNPFYMGETDTSQKQRSEPSEFVPKCSLHTEIFSTNLSMEGIDPPPLPTTHADAFIKICTTVRQGLLGKNFLIRYSPERKWV